MAHLDLWDCANEVALDFSRPGKSTENGFIEAFNDLRAALVSNRQNASNPSKRATLTKSSP